MGCGSVHLWGVEGSIYGAGESTYGVWRGPSMGRGGSIYGGIYGAGEPIYGAGGVPLWGDLWGGRVHLWGGGGSIYGAIYGAGESIYGAGGVHLGGIYGAGESIYGAGGSRGSAPPPSIAAQGHK